MDSNNSLSISESDPLQPTNEETIDENLQEEDNTEADSNSETDPLETPQETKYSIGLNAPPMPIKKIVKKLIKKKDLSGLGVPPNPSHKIIIPSNNPPTVPGVLVTPPNPGLKLPPNPSHKIVPLTTPTVPGSDGLSTPPIPIKIKRPIKILAIKRPPNTENQN